MNTSPIVKLTAFTAQWNGKHVQCFIMCEYINDKAYMSIEQVENVLKQTFGLVPLPGTTFNIG